MQNLVIPVGTTLFAAIYNNEPTVITITGTEVRNNGRAGIFFSQKGQKPNDFSAPLDEIIFYPNVDIATTICYAVVMEDTRYSDAPNDVHIKYLFDVLEAVTMAENLELMSPNIHKVIAFRLKD